MTYQIQQLSCYAEKILRQPSEGTVHSVYRRTVNLKAGSRLLALQAKGSVLSPISLVTGLAADRFDTLAVKAGAAVHFEPERIRVTGPAGQDNTFLYSGADRYDLELSALPDPHACRILAAHIRDAVSSAETGGLQLLFHGKQEQDLPLMLLASRNHLSQCKERCAGGEFREAAAKLSRLIGLGIGLTPSGDDFLCGVLAGLRLSGNEGHPFAHFLRAEIAGRLSDTIDISAAFLSCALDHNYSLPVSLLGRLPDRGEILASFGEIGHSSGMDTLCGILWSLEQFPPEHGKDPYRNPAAPAKRSISSGNSPGLPLSPP